MLNKQIDAGILKSYNKLYQNPWFLMKKKSGVYKIIIAAMKMNGVTIKDTNLSLNLNKFAENFIKMSISSLMNYFLKYNNFPSYAESRNMITVALSLNLLK